MNTPQIKNKVFKNYIKQASLVNLIFLFILIYSMIYDDLSKGLFLMFFETTSLILIYFFGFWFKKNAFSKMKIFVYFLLGFFLILMFYLPLLPIDLFSDLVGITPLLKSFLATENFIQQFAVMQEYFGYELWIILVGFFIYNIFYTKSLYLSNKNKLNDSHGEMDWWDFTSYYTFTFLISIAVIFSLIFVPVYIVGIFLNNEVLVFNILYVAIRVSLHHIKKLNLLFIKKSFR